MLQIFWTREVYIMDVLYVVSFFFRPLPKFGNIEVG